MFLDVRLDRLPARITVGNVELHQPCAGARLLARLGRLVRALPVGMIMDHDLKSIAAKSTGDGLPYSFAGSRNECRSAHLDSLPAQKSFRLSLSG